MAKFENLPDFYTQREVDKTRRRQRNLGRVEGAAVIVAGGLLIQFLNWIPGLLVLSVVAYVLYRVLKPKKPDDAG